MASSKSTTTRKTAARKTPTRKTTAKKTPLPKVARTSRSAKAKSVAAQTPPSPPEALAAGQEPSPVVVAPVAARVTQPALSRKALIEETVLRSGVKKKDAKPVVEAMLAILGETVAAGRDLNLKPFGKLHINRSESRSNGTVHVCRLRQPLAEEKAQNENEAAGEDSSHTPLATAAG